MVAAGADATLARLRAAIDASLARRSARLAKQRTKSSFSTWRELTSQHFNYAF